MFVPVTSMVPLPVPLVGPMARPRLALNVNVPVSKSVPPLMTRLPGVALLGAVPRLLSAEMLSTPPSIVVLPL